VLIRGFKKYGEIYAFIRKKDKFSANNEQLAIHLEVSDSHYLIAFPVLQYLFYYL